MVTIRSANEIIQSLIDFFKLAQPDLDTKPATVARDLFIDAPAAQLSILYDQLSGVVDKQSFRLVVGSDLDKLAKNFGLVRKQSTPSSGVALMTFASITAPININQGDIVTATNGLSFTVSVGLSVIPAATNFYRSVATKFSNQLAFAGITDPYAVEVTVAATSPGSQGNIGSYALDKVTTPGVSNITNINSFQGGTDQETDSSFRNRVLASFNGASVGTTLGYLNTALSTTGTLDAVVIGPGNPLMTRDGTVTKTNPDGSLTIVSEGSGGKVDIYVLGSNLVQNSDSYIYQDKSNNNNPTSPKNNFVLGQIAADANKTVTQKRIDDIAAGVLPNQPVQGILQVSASLSGSNFVQQTTDGYGRTSGNYKLIKDTGVYAGSPWGFDTFAWTDDRIRDFQDSLVKGQYNGQDAATFTGITEIHDVQQSLSITNENSTITSDRTIIQLLHTPITSVTRVFNVNTGERYIIANQNLDATTPFNNTGRIKISGNTLPAPSDVLQVDYTWIVDFDQYTDFDGLVSTQNIRPVSDSIDWGYPSEVRNEIVQFSAVAANNFFMGTTTLPIATILSTSTFLQVDGYVQLITSGTFVNRLSITLTNLAIPTVSVDSVTWKNSNVELFNTAQNNNFFSNVSQVVGISILYTTNIILPSDTVATSGDRVTVYLNSINVFQSNTIQGSASGAQITIPSTLINTSATIVNLRVSYIANITDLYSSAITSIPVSRVGNGFILNNNNGFNNFSIVNTSRRENQLVQKNLSNQYFVELNLLVSDYNLYGNEVLSIIRLSDGYEFWNLDNQGSIITGQDGNYQLVISPTLVPPNVGDRVLILYYASDIRRFQPFSFNNETIKTRIDSLVFDPTTKKFTIPLIEFTPQASNLNFQVLDDNTNTTYFNVTDGYLSVPNVSTAILNSLSVNFNTLPDITNKRIKITGATSPNNDGYFDIISYDPVSNNITITSTMNKITNDQIMVVRILDGQELWNYGGTLDFVNNRLLLPSNANAQAGDLVYVLFFNFQNVRKAPTRLIGTTQDQIINAGTIAISGTTLGIVKDVVFTSTSAGLQINLQEALQTALSISSGTNISSNIKIAKLLKLQKVVTVSQTNDEVLETLVTYDVKNTAIANNLYYADQMISSTSLSNLECILPNTANNTANIGTTSNLPALGDQLLVTFYYTIDNDLVSLSYTRNGSLYTNKRFALINKMYVSSGLNASQATKFTVTSYTQPTLGAKYNAFYDYLAPKQNERIVISYDDNQLVSDVTFNVETARPINADVLVKQAVLVLLDLTMNVVISSNFQSSSTTVLQNLRSALLTALTTTTLGQTIDQITLINIAQGVQGIARARILYFNKTGAIGQVLSITALQNQYFQPNNLIINTESL